MESVNITTGANQGTHNVVYIATQHDSLYAIDSNTGVILWQDALLTAEHGGTVTSVPNGAVGSSDISPEIGITATPVIDPATNTIFVENKTQEVASNGTHFEHHLYAINLGSGAITNKVLIADSIGDTVVSGPSVSGNGAGSSGGVVKFDALRQMDRPGLTLVNGTIYLAYASHGDNGPYHGWILGYSESTLALTAVFNANPNGSDDGIWQGGGTLAYETVNGNTYLYLETGNGSFDTTLIQSPFNSSLKIPNQGDYGDTFIKLEIDGSTPASGSLDATNNANGWGMHVADYFTPINEGNLSNGDTDLGSGAPLLLPASAGSAAHPSLMVGSGKEGRIYLIDRNNMGGYHGDAAGDGNSGTDNVVQETATGAINGSLDTPTFFNGVLYYVGGYGDEARTFTVANGVMSSTSVTQSTDSYPFPGSTATITTNSSGGNAIVWDIAGPGTNQLRAYNASQGYSSEIYTSAQAASSRDSFGSAVKFTVPTVADGEAFVGTTNSVVAYGLIKQATAPPAAPTNLSATAFSGSVINLNWTDNDTAPNTATGYNIFQSSDGVTFSQVGTASAGATSFAIGGLTISTKYYFEIDAFNAKGTSALSNVANATTTNQASVLDFSNGFADSSGVLTYNGSAKINGTSAELTDGGGTEAGSVFSTNAVDVTKFSTQFTFQLTNANADGFTFAIQGDGPTALGPSGGGLGYGPDTPGGTPGIANSVAVKFDLYNNAGEGTDSTGEYTDGASPTTPFIDLSNTGINLHSGDVFKVVMGSNGTTLNVTITDTSTNASASQAYTVNIPQVIGSGTGYVGFTGGTGGATAVQNILTWAYSPTASTLPAAPSNLTGTVISGSEIDISWTNNANNATAVLIDRSTDGVNFSQIASVSATTTTYHDTSLSPGNTYYYEVQATNAAGNSAFSNVFQASTLTAPPPPTNLVATNITTTEVDLSWTNVATDATGIKILEQLGSNSSRVIANGLAPTTTSYKITGLTPGSPYLFEVDALNSNGPSGATTIAVDTLPPQVTGVTATGAPGQVTISWTADQGALNYDIYRATTAGGEGTTPTWTAIAGTSYVDATVTPGTTYYYVVTAVDPNSASPTDPTGESAKSAEVSAIITAVPTVVTSGGPFVYDGTAHSASAVAYGVDGVTPVNGTFTFTYSGVSTPPTRPGTYSVVATFTSSNPDYVNTTGTGTLIITKATPLFTNLSSPTIIVGTTSVTLSGDLAAGPVFPTGDTVSVTLHNVTKNATVNSSGSFSVSFGSSNLAQGSYTITYSFAGDASYFNAAANGTGTLTVNPKPAAPHVTTSPTPQTILVGTSVTFTAAAKGVPTPTVQWQVSTDGGTTYTNIAGATSTTLSFTTNFGQNGYKYRAIFTNSLGSATTYAAKLTVDTPPTVTLNPSSQTVAAGRTVTFKATGTGNPAPTDQWQISTDGGLTWTNITGATKIELVFVVNASENGDEYRAVFTNPFGTATSSAAVLTV